MTKWKEPLGKVISLLLLLPSTILYFHINGILNKEQYCLIGPKSNDLNLEKMYGIYKLSSGNNLNQISTYTSNWKQYGWPSAPILTYELTSSNFRYQTGQGELIQNGDQWCLVKDSNILECGDLFDRSTWSLYSVTCPLSWKKNQKNQNQKNQNLEFILSYPATTLLLCVNIGLAYYYWDKRISPNKVAKSYNAIVYEKEIWRSFSGAFAHFEIFHLGFNMMSLTSCGKALEPIFGSLPFLCWNLSLVVFTTILMMGLTRFRIHMANSLEEKQILKEQKTVGYSGVLFAWMVIISMEQSKSCPIFFMPDLCFESFSLFYLQFNVSPIVSLIVMQILLPRVSFVGHLSGILCGFALHWKWLRFGFCVPNVWGTIVMVVWLWKVDKILQRDEIYLLDTLALEEDSTESTYESMKTVLTQFFSQTQSRFYFQMTNYGLMVITLGTMFLFDYGIVFCQVVSTFIFYFASKNENISSSGHILKAYTILALVMIVTDSMSLPGWWICRTLISSNRKGNIWVVLTMAIIRIILHFVGLLLCTQVITDESGFYHYAMGPILHYGKQIKIGESKSNFQAFETRGHVLGN